MLKNLKMVKQVIFGRGCLNQLDTVLNQQRQNADNDGIVFLVDHVFKNGTLKDQLPRQDCDLLLWINTDAEPTTAYADQLKTDILAYCSKPAGIVGIGGGSTLDLAKTLSILLTNSGSAKDYQGWDLVPYPGIYHVGIPTLSGTGAEASRTAVLKGPDKKLGVNSDYSVFDQILLDPELTMGVPEEQQFFTGMDCYIHCAEALSGSYANAFSTSYGEKALELCRQVFLGISKDAAADLMMASYFGGLSIAYSQVGVCHALSYGLSFVLGVRHGVGNCMVFEHLGDFYPDFVNEYYKMKAVNAIKLPIIDGSRLTGKELDQMIKMALFLEPLWENAMGKDWKKRITHQRLQELYLSILT